MVVGRRVAVLVAHDSYWKTQWFLVYTHIPPEYIRSQLGKTRPKVIQQIASKGLCLLLPIFATSFLLAKARDRAEAMLQEDTRNG